MAWIRGPGCSFILSYIQQLEHESQILINFYHGLELRWNSNETVPIPKQAEAQKSRFCKIRYEFG